MRMTSPCQRHAKAYKADEQLRPVTVLPYQRSGEGQVAHARACRAGLGKGCLSAWTRGPVYLAQPCAFFAEALKVSKVILWLHEVVLVRALSFQNVSSNVPHSRELQLVEACHRMLSRRCASQPPPAQHLSIALSSAHTSVRHRESRPSTMAAPSSYTDSPPGYEKYDQHQNNPKRPSDAKVQEPWSLPEHVGASRSQHVAFVVSQLVPQLRERASRGLSKSTLMLIPSDQGM